FTKTLAMEIQYIGQWGFGLFGERDTNAPVIAADPAHPGFFYFQNQPKVNPSLGTTARPDNRFTAIRTNENSRTSHYNGLLVSAIAASSSACQGWSPTFMAGELGPFGTTFLSPAYASGLGAFDALSGEVVVFPFLNGNMGRDAGMGAPFYKIDLSLHKGFKI